MNAHSFPVGQMNGVMMQRAFGVVATAVLVSMAGGGPAAAGSESTVERATSIDVAALLTAAHGAPPLICALAAQAVRNYGWGNWTDAPSTPLSAVVPMRDRDIDNSRFPAADVERLLAGLA